MIVERSKNNPRLNKEALKKRAESFSGKKVIAFDLDGTLAQSKMSIDTEMAELLQSLLARKIVAVIGGGSHALFQEQFLFALNCREDLLEHLLLLPTSGATFCTFKNGEWIVIHQDILTRQEREKIKQGILEVLNDMPHGAPKKTYGPIIEDRGTEVTFSALGMRAPLKEKQAWNREQDMRREMVRALSARIPEFEIRLGGLTSLDITKKGIDKSHGISQIMEKLSVSIDEIAYVGDALYEGGNDAAVLVTGVDTVQVSGPEDTKYFIRSLLGAIV